MAQPFYQHIAPFLGFVAHASTRAASTFSRRENFRDSGPLKIVATRRRLPHIYKEGRWLFLTWNLHGSIGPSQFAPPKKTTAGEAFALMDRKLDTARTGPLFLRQEAIANLMVSSLGHCEKQNWCDLAAYVVMPNHVHVLLLPKMSVSRLMKSLKGYTAREANKLLIRTGEPFWQKESYDHWVRDEAEWARILRYIEMNPVRAGFVAAPEDYRWSSANIDMKVDAARLEARATSLLD